MVPEIIVSDPYSKTGEQLSFNGKGLQNIRFYSGFQLERWKEELKIAKMWGNCYSKRMHWPLSIRNYIFGKEVRKIWCRGMQISLSSPLGEGVEIPCSDSEFVFNVVKDVVKNIKIPVMVKLSQHVNNISEIMKDCKKGGASAMSAINAVDVLGVD